MTIHVSTECLAAGAFSVLAGAAYAAGGGWPGVVVIQFIFIMTLHVHHHETKRP